MEPSRRGEPLSRVGLPSERPFVGSSTVFGPSSSMLSGHSISSIPTVRMPSTLTDRGGHVLPGQGHHVPSIATSHIPTTFADRGGHVLPGQGHGLTASRVNSVGTSLLSDPFMSSAFVPERVSHIPVVHGAPVVLDTGRGRHSHLTRVESGFGGFGVMMLIIAAVCVVFPFMLVALVA